MNELLLIGSQTGVSGGNTLLLLQATRVNGSGIPVDTAKPGRVISKWDSPAGVSTTTSKFEGVSFDCRLGGYLVAAANKSDLVFPKNKDFTIEWWGYTINRINGSFLLNFNPPAGPSSLDFISGGALRLRDSINTAVPESPVIPSLSSWAHYAIVGNGEVLSFSLTVSKD